MENQITVHTDEYNKVYACGFMQLYFNRRNTWDDGRLLLVDPLWKKVYMVADAEYAFDMCDDVDDDHMPTWAEIYNAMQDIMEEDEELTEYYREYGDLDQGLTTLLARGGYLSDKKKMQELLVTV